MRGVGSYGARLFLGNPVKIKGVNINPSIANLSHSTDLSGWDSMWGVDYDWTGDIKHQIDLSKTQGANCVKITGSGTGGQYPAAVSTFNDRLRLFLDYTYAQELYVYWNFTSVWLGSVAAYTTPMTNVLGILAQYPHVIGVDIHNEFNNAANPTTAQMQTLLQTARSIQPDLPYTASLLCTSAAVLSGGVAQAIASYCDYLDFHPYYTVGDPADSDWATYRAQAWAIPWLIGECGQNVAAGVTAQTSRWQALGDIAKAASDSYGSVGFCLKDYNAGAGDQYGMYDSTATTPKTQITTPFQTWFPVTQ